MNNTIHKYHHRTFSTTVSMHVSEGSPVEENSNTDNNSQGCLTRQEYIKREEQSIKEDSVRLERVKGQITTMVEEHNEKFTYLQDEVKYFSNRVNSDIEDVSQDTKNEINNTTEKYDTMKKTLRGNIEAVLNEDISNEDLVKIQHLKTAHDQMGLILADKVVKLGLQDDNLREESREELENLEKDIKQCKENNKRVAEYRVHATKEELDHEEKIKNLNDIKNLNNTKNETNSSLVDDFADVSTEMPSYMDPED